MKLFRSFSFTQKLVALFLTVIVAYFELSFISSSHWENPPQQIGVRDFIAYWAAYRVFQNGGDPYTGAQVLESQNSIIADWHTPQEFLNPPWALTLLSPFLCYDFQIARWLWLLWNVFFLFGSAYFISRFFNDEFQISYRLLGLTSILFLPALMTIWVGQLSLLITFCMLLMLLCLKNQRDFLAGFLLVPLTIKPHTIYLVLLTLGIWILRERRWKIVLSFSFGFSLIVFITLLRSPHIFIWWIHMSFSPLIFQTPTLVSLTRKLIAQFSGSTPVWPAYFFPCIGTLISLLMLSRNNFQIQWKKDIPFLFTFSLIFAPYAWFYDFTLLLWIHLGVLIQTRSTNINQSQKTQALLLIAGVQILILISGMFSTNLFYLFWVPLALLYIWVRTERILSAN